jgi:hypothetical protein
VARRRPTQSRAGHMIYVGGESTSYQHCSSLSAEFLILTVGLRSETDLSARPICESLADRCRLAEASSMVLMGVRAACLGSPPTMIFENDGV